MNKKWHLWRWIAPKWFMQAMAALLVLVTLFYVEENWRGRWTWKNYETELETKGEKLDFASFIPPPVSDDHNFALTPVVASSYSRILDKNGHEISPVNTNVVNLLEMKLDRQNLSMNPNMDFGSWQKGKCADLKSWQAYFRTIFITNRWELGMPPPPAPYMVISAESKTPETNKTEEVIALTTNEFPITAQPQSPSADVLFALSKFGSAIEELRQASRLTYSRFPLNYEVQPANIILLPHLSSLKICSQILQLRAIAELKSGQNEQALADVELIIFLADSVRNEPTLISHLVQSSVLSLAIQPIWESLEEHRWSHAQLAAIESKLGEFNFTDTYQFCVRSERATSIETIDCLERNRSFGELRKEFYWGEDEVGNSVCSRIYQAGVFNLIPKGWFYQNEVAVARTFQQALLTESEVKQMVITPDIARKAADARVSEFQHRSPYNYFVGMFFPSVEPQARRFAFTQASVDMARTACALERYHLAHGEYPEKIDTLTPQFIETIPHDIINGQPLQYRRTSDGQFVLYSIGWNEKDDGGTPGLNKYGRVDLREGDWVWQYPQK